MDVKMSMNEMFKTESLRDLVFFPLLFNVVGLFFMGLLYVAYPETTIGSTQFNFVVYLSVFIVEWLLAFIVIRRFRKKNIRLKEFIIPKKEFRWMPAIVVFVSLNVLFAIYVLHPLIPIPPMKNLDLTQLLFFFVLAPVTAGFVEELIWRGHFVEKLLAKGYSESKAVLFSAISFAFIHGFFILDKLIVTFLFGLIAGIYYARERNLVVLTVTHVVLDVIAFALKIVV